MSAQEPAEVLTSSIDEVKWTRGETQDDQPVMSLPVWFKAYQRPGYLSKLAGAPAAVAEHRRARSRPIEVIGRDLAGPLQIGVETVLSTGWVV
ncbi:hypothetical protein [Streptosporangium sp. NPDC023615]|uniref:hypothetical protein n=1 Tax=Streptosporangium sp. NPDC023615 TaxID=3154794 RepID=UPI003430B720